MMKVSFDAEDFPPASYFAKIDENVRSVQNVLNKDENGNSPETVTDSQVFWNKKYRDVDSIPEFIPRSSGANKGHINEVPLRLQTDVEMLPQRRPVSMYEFQKPNIHLQLQNALHSRPHFGVGAPIFGPARPYGMIPMGPQRPEFHPGVHLMTRPHPHHLMPGPALIPPGYAANITHINTGIGPPVPALLLKKKRKKKNRVKVAVEEGRVKIVDNQHVLKADVDCVKESRSNSSCEPDSIKSDPCLPVETTTSTSQDIDNSEGINDFEVDNFYSSCPDLTDERVRKSLSEIELDNPMLRHAVKSMLETEKPTRSNAVEELDTKIIHEMNLQDKLGHYKHEEEDIFDILLRDSTIKPNVDIDDPFRPKTLQDEFDETYLFHGTTSLTTIPILGTPRQSAIVHTSGGQSQSYLVSDYNKISDKFARKGLEAINRNLEETQLHPDEPHHKSLPILPQSKTCCSMM